MANRRARTFAAILALVALAASPATALDGEVLIDQAAAQAGGITPDDVPGFPVTISRPGKYKLTGKLGVPAGKNGIAVTTDNVTLDLNGFKIAGGNQGNIGLNAPDVDGLTVMNGTIANFTSHGITTRKFAIIQDMQINDNGGIGVKLTTAGRVQRSTISANSGVNIFCVSKCLITGNIVTGSDTESGIGLFTNAGGHLVLGNVIADNQGFAIYAEGVTGFGNNTLTNNGTFNGSQINGAVNVVHPNFCQPACP